MAFVKERISEADKDLFDSFKVYDYGNERTLTWELVGGSMAKWVVEREQEIYFFYVSGGHHLEQHPYQQYDLIWKGEKTVIFIEKYVKRNPTTDNPMRLHSIYNVVEVRASKALKNFQDKLIILIKELIKAEHSVNVLNSGTFINKNTWDIKITASLNFLDEVK